MEDRIVHQSVRSGPSRSRREGLVRRDRAKRGLDLVTKVTSSKGKLWLAPTPW
jgi:hypothetical protein